MKVDPNLPHALLVIPLILSAGMAAATPPPQAVEAAIDDPETRRGEVVDDLFGEEIADPYRWLENDARRDGDVAARVQAQKNKAAETHLPSLPGRDVFQEQKRPADDVEVRLHAAAAGSVIRVLNEEIGAAVLAGVDRPSPATPLERIASAVWLATGGVVGDPVASQQGSAAKS